MKKQTGQKEIMKKVLDYIRPQWLLVLLSLLMAVVSVALTLYLPVLTGNVVDHILGPGKVEFSAIFEIMRTMAAAIVVTAAAQWIMNVCNNKIVYTVTRNIREEAFAKIEILPLKYLDTHSSGDIVSRIIADVDQFADGLLMGFTQLFTGIVTIVGTLFFMLSVNAGITVVVVVLTPVSVLVANFIAKRTYSMFKLQSKTRGEQTALINEMIENQKVVQAYGQEEKVQMRFDEINDRLQKCSLRATFFSSITNPSTRFVNSLVYTAVGLAGAFAAVRGVMTVGQLSAFLSYANQYTKPFNEISGVITDSSTGYTMLIKMVNNNSNKSYDSACDEAITSAKQTAYNEWLAKLEKKHQIKKYDSVWNDVKIGTVTTSIVTADDLSKMAEADSSSSKSK